MRPDGTPGLCHWEAGQTDTPRCARPDSRHQLATEPYPDAPRARRCARNIASIVGGHHGTNPTSADVEKVELSLAREEHLWKATRDEVLDTMAAHTGADEFLPT